MGVDTSGSIFLGVIAVLVATVGVLAYFSRRQKDQTPEQPALDAPLVAEAPGITQTSTEQAVAAGAISSEIGEGIVPESFMEATDPSELAHISTSKGPESNTEEPLQNADETAPSDGDICGEQPDSGPEEGHEGQPIAGREVQRRSPDKRGGRPRGRMEAAQRKTQRPPRPEIVCWKRARQWVLGLELPEELSKEESRQIQKHNKMDSAEYKYVVL